KPLGKQARPIQECTTMTNLSSSIARLFCAFAVLVAAGPFALYGWQRAAQGLPSEPEWLGNHGPWWFGAPCNEGDFVVFCWSLLFLGCFVLVCFLLATSFAEILMDGMRLTTLATIARTWRTGLLIFALYVSLLVAQF